MKKMRRLIPAVAMLMVAAVMLSTASFAWFTMNTAVTASGMQIQAQADSSLVISDAPLKYNTGAPSVDFDTDATRLTPMNYGTYNDGYTDVQGWRVPTNTAGINTLTGVMVEGDVWKYASPVAGQHYIEKEVYIASAGAAMENKQITISLAAPVSSIGSAVKAYAAALYYVPATIVVDDETVSNPAWEDNMSVDLNQTPDKIVYVDDAAKRNVVTLDETFNIPSILNVGEQNDDTTGIKIIIRFFVDGDLESVGNDKVEVTTGYKYEKAQGKYNSSVQYYVAGEDTFKYNVVSNPVEGNFGSYFVESAGVYTQATGTFDATGKTTYYTQETVKNYVQAIVPAGMTADTEVLATWFVRNAITSEVNYKYIRTDDVPGTGSELELTFTTK